MVFEISRMEQTMSQNVPGLVQASSLEEFTRVQINAIQAYGRQLGRPLSILEAGCGQRWSVDLTGTEYSLTGVDLDADALDLRKTKVHDLDVAICGDLCSLELPEASFDVVYSSFVLEHVPRADVALQNFFKWLKPGGLLVLILPDRDSALGFLSRILPPYPTSYHPVTGSKRFSGFLAEHGMNLLACYGNGFSYRDPSNAIDAIVRGAVAKFISILSWGRLSPEYNDVLYLASKPPAN
jgi:SAM-dependent methyltransferase